MLVVMWSQKFSLTDVAWQQVLFPDTGSTISHLLDPGKHGLLQTLDDSLSVESEVMWEDKLGHNVTIVIDHPKLPDVDWLFGFHQYQYILEGNSTPMVVLGLLSIQAEFFFLSGKKQSTFG